MPSPLAGEIEGAIGRDPRDRKRMAVVTRGGKPALTRYRTLRAWQTSAALLECRLATGRTHQIRVHLAGQGHPIVGDPVYLRRIPAAARLLPAPLRQTLLDFPRQALHAARLGLRPPGHRPAPGVRNPAAGGFPGVAGGAGRRSACTAGLSYRDLTKG